MMFKHIIHNLAPVAAIAMALLAGGCQTDDSDVVQLPVDSEITFGATVHEISAARTRTLEVKDITHNYDVDFFVQLDYAKDENSVDSIKRYVVASSYDGRLEAKNSSDRLIWHDATSDHTFYAWTLPWITDEEKKSKYADETEGERCLEMYYDEDGNPKIEVVFHDSGNGTDFDTYRNNEILEKFIGAQMGPCNYKQQGTYVPLTFYHLVSQIFFNKLTVIRGDGSRHENLKANLTFIGMPKKAKFDPHPSTEPKSPHPAEWIAYPDKDWKEKEHPHHPVVIGPELYDLDSELTFFMPQEPENDRPHHHLYVCPELDFSQLAYKVTIVDEAAIGFEYGIEYYGDFSSVEFKREGTEYDKIDKDTGKPDHSDDKVLHAGEMMTLNITLYPGIGPGATIVIQDWSDPQPTESSHYAHPGIFTDNAAQELADAKAEDMNELFNLYGETVNDEKVFKIYENVTVTGNSFPVHDGYIIDGMGHTITMDSSPVTVGAMRDVYLTDGTNIIWIDSDGNIWTLNPTTKMFGQTSYSISGKSSSIIDLKTGVVS